MRVDFNSPDRNSFDLGLLGAATGMCSYSGDCDACQYRDSNPCKVSDRYGADPGLCLLPGFMGGGVAADQLCGIGASADVVVDAARANVADADGAGASLSAFRTRNGSLVITVAARCGWLLVPSYTTAAAAAAASGAAADLLLLEGSVSYGGQRLAVSVPAGLAGATAAAAAVAEGRDAQTAAAAAAERYSCLSTVVRLRGLSSRCQALSLTVDLRMALQRAMPVPALGAEDGVAAGADPGVTVYGEGGQGPAVCRESGQPVEAEVQLTMSPPQEAQRLRAAVAEATAAAAAGSQPGQQQQAAVAAQLYSNGVAATATYSATLDPRAPETASWLASLSAQSPLLQATRTHESLSFLLGPLVGAYADSAASAAAGMAADDDGGGAQAPLLKEAIVAEVQRGCGAVSAADVAAAVVAALAPQGVSAQHVASVTCLERPFAEVPAAELPPCTSYVPLLFNISLEMPLESPSSGGGLGSGGASSAMLSSLSDAGASPADPRVLADALERASFLPPLACVSTQSQMRMTTTIRLSVQLPRGPGSGDGSYDAVALLPSPVGLPAPLSRPTPPPPSGSANPLGSAGASTGAGSRSGSTALGTTATVAVAVAVALAVLLAGTAVYALRSVRRAKVAAQQAATAAAAAAAATAAAAAGGAAGGTSAAALALAKTSVTVALPMGPPLAAAEPSYVSSEEEDEAAASTPATQQQLQQASRQHEPPQQQPCRPSEERLVVPSTAPDAAGGRGDGEGASPDALAPEVAPEGVVLWGREAGWRAGDSLSAPLPLPVPPASRVQSSAAASGAGDAGSGASSNDDKPRSGAKLSAVSVPRDSPSAAEAAAAASATTGPASGGAAHGSVLGASGAQLLGPPPATAATALQLQLHTQSPLARQRGRVLRIPAAAAAAAGSRVERSGTGTHATARAGMRASGLLHGVARSLGLGLGMSFPPPQGATLWTNVLYDQRHSPADASGGGACPADGASWESGAFAVDASATRGDGARPSRDASGAAAGTAPPAAGPSVQEPAPSAALEVEAGAGAGTGSCAGGAGTAPFANAGERPSGRAPGTQAGSTASAATERVGAVAAPPPPPLLLLLQEDRAQQEARQRPPRQRTRMPPAPVVVLPPPGEAQLGRAQAEAVPARVAAASHLGRGAASASAGGAARHVAAAASWPQRAAAGPVQVTQGSAAAAPAAALSVAAASAVGTTATGAATAADAGSPVSPQSPILPPSPLRLTHNLRERGELLRESLRSARITIERVRASAAPTAAAAADAGADGAPLSLRASLGSGSSPASRFGPPGGRAGLPAPLLIPSAEERGGRPAYPINSPDAVHVMRVPELQPVATAAAEVAEVALAAVLAAGGASRAGLPVAGLPVAAGASIKVIRRAPSRI